MWTKAVVTANAPNSPNAVWSVGIGDNNGNIYHPLAFGIGQSLSCGPYTLAPGEVLVVSIVGGGAADNIKGTLFGLQDVDPTDLTMDTAVGSSSSVIINGGTVTVTVTGTVPVSIAGTVNIAGAVTVSGAVTVTSGTVSISGTVTIAGAVTVTSGTVSISGTVTVAGSVSISSGTVSISGTVNIAGNVTISSGTVNIGGTPTINIVQAGGVPVYGPNLLTAAQAGPITGGWVGEDSTLVYNADGTVKATQGAGGSQNIVTPVASIPVTPGQTIHLAAHIQAVDHNNNSQLYVRQYDAAGVNTSAQAGPSTSTPVGTWIYYTFDVVIPAGVYSLQFAAVVTGAGTPGDRYLMSDAFCGVVGTVAISGNVVITAGTVNIAGTVTVAGSVSITSGTVSISGTVNIAGSVSITSGTVSISGTANINIAAQSITVGVNLPWTAVTSFTTVGGGAETFTTAAVPVGTQTLGILVEANRNLTSLRVKGVTTGTYYEVGVTGVSQLGFITVPINASRDSTYTLDWASSSGVGTKIDVDATALAMGYPALGQNGSAESVPVAIANDQTYPPLAATSIVQLVGAGTLIAAVGGQHVRLFSVNVEVTTGVAGSEVRLTLINAGTDIAGFSTAAAGNSSMSFYGLPLAVGEGLKTTIAGGAPVERTTLVYGIF